MVETLLDNSAQWLSGTGQDADIAVACQCKLSRNLSDFHFPAHCRTDERASIEERFKGVLDSLSLLSTGVYWSLDDLDPSERRLLEERRLIGPALIEAAEHAGVYVADDQSLSITVNDEDHIVIRGLASGVQMSDVWSRVSVVDDMLAGVLDYAHNERLGYLTTSIAEVGTGLKVYVDLHLPALIMANQLVRAEEQVKEKRHRLTGVFAGKGEPEGELLRIENVSTLGQSEDEILFHLKHLTGELVALERDARSWMMSEASLQVEDRVGRALGVARGGRMLSHPEGLALLSSLRLGVSTGLIDQYSLQQLNEVLVASQDAHLAVKSGAGEDSLALSTERADLFRSRFA